MYSCGWKFGKWHLHFSKDGGCCVTVSGNTIENANAAVDTWLSTGIMVCEGLSLNGRVPGVTEG